MRPMPARLIAMVFPASMVFAIRMDACCPAGVAEEWPITATH
jgi:hypothetical protein